MAANEPFSRRLLLIGWDAVDWPTARPLLQAGFLPNLARLIAGGTSGDLATLYPVTSPIVWTSALTGVRADRHGIFGYVDAPNEDTDASQARLVTPADRSVPALWDFVAQRGGRAHVVNWPCSYPAYPVGGVSVSDAALRGLAADTLNDFPLPLNAIHVPDALADERTSTDWSALRMAAGEVEPAVLARFLPGAGPVPRWLAPALAACFTVHNFATAALETGDDWNLAAIRYPGLLPLAIARARGGSDVSSDSAALEGLLRLHDLFLGRLLELTRRGPETAILLLSAHGFPARMVENETDLRAGMLVACHSSNQDSSTGGNRRLIGAGLLDVAPTALALLGFEPAVATEAGMTGRILTMPSQTSPSPVLLRSKPGIHTESQASNKPWQSASLAPEADAAALSELRLEGLIPDDQSTNDVGASRSVFLSQLWAQARVLSYAGKTAESIPLLRQLLTAAPENVEVAFLLANDLQVMERREEAWEIVTPLLVLDAAVPPEISARAHFFVAEDALSHGKRAQAMSHLSQAAALTTSSGLLLGIGRALYRLRRFHDADACFIRVLDTDSMEPIAWMGHAGMAILTRRNEDAIEYAQRAISLHHDSALSHLILARALRATNHPREARAAYAMALRLGIHAHQSAVTPAEDH